MKLVLCPVSFPVDRTGMRVVMMAAALGFEAKIAMPGLPHLSSQVTLQREGSQAISRALLLEAGPHRHWYLKNDLMWTRRCTSLTTEHSRVGECLYEPVDESGLTLLAWLI